MALGQKNTSTSPYHRQIQAAINNNEIDADKLLLFHHFYRNDQSMGHAVPFRLLMSMSLFVSGAMAKAEEGKAGKSQPERDSFVLERFSDEEVAREIFDPQSLEWHVAESLPSRLKRAKDKRLSEFSRGSSLIFHGRAIRKTHGTTLPNIGPFSDVPLTFVEFEVLEVLAGKYDGATFTLRYVGGPKSADEFLLVTHINNFNVGDEEILAIDRNGYVMDPVMGRFRIFDDTVYTASGHKVLTGDKDEMVVSRDKTSEKTVTTIVMGADSFSAANNLPLDAPDVNEDAGALEQSRGLRPMKSSSLKKLIRSSIKSRSQSFPESEESASSVKHREFKSGK
jgi:hypothetical protein